MSAFPTDAEREAAERALHNVLSPNDATYAADDVLDALAPLVADRERAAAARALREAASTIPPDCYVGPGWLEDRADELEAGR